MVCRNLHHAHLQEVGLVQITADHVKWHGFWMRIKGPPSYMVTALGSYVKWP